MLEHIRASVLTRFLERSFVQGAPSLHVLENPTEEIIDGLKRGKPARLFQKAGTAPVLAPMRAPPRRVEENYLYSTRAFQAGALASADYRFFQNAIGQAPTGDGFPAAVTNLSDLETNMDVGGQIAQGKNFAFRQVGISFNTLISRDNIGTLLDAGALRFSKQGDQYQLRHGPLRLWPGGTGISGFTTETNSGAVHNGLSDPRAVRSLRIPRVIKEKESFAYIYVVPRTVQANDGATAFTIEAPGALMTVWLWGGQVDVIPG